MRAQCFHNLNLHEDIFNHSNIHFWEYMQPGYDTLGFISCTGELRCLHCHPPLCEQYVRFFHLDDRLPNKLFGVYLWLLLKKPSPGRTRAPAPEPITSGTVDTSWIGPGSIWLLLVTSIGGLQ